MPAKIAAIEAVLDVHESLCCKVRWHIQPEEANRGTARRCMLASDYASVADIHVRVPRDTRSLTKKEKE